MVCKAPQPGATQAVDLFADILCQVDGTRMSYEAVAQSARLVRSGGRIKLLAVTDTAGAGEYATASLAPARAARALARAQLSIAEVDADCTVYLDERGPVVDVLLEHARQHRLLVLPAPSMPRAAHVLLGGAATRAVHVLPASILLARRPPASAVVTERVIVASDALEHSTELVRFALELARRHGSSLMLLHAITGPSSHHPTRLARQLELVTGALGDQAKVRIEAGHAHGLIVEAARAERATLLVLSSRQLGGLRALGSVSERVAHEAPCSVLVVRAEDLPH